MDPHRTQRSIPNRSARRRAWADLSLRNQLLLFALGLVTVPGLVFALIAFSGARAALEREVGIRLRQTAEHGADAVAATLERARSDARSWARQDLMRELLVRDLDKRVSRFLATVRDSKTAYLEVLCADGAGDVVAAASGKWIGRNVRDWHGATALLEGSEWFLGPTTLPGFPRDVLAIGVPVENPDAPGARIGGLILLYDWGAVGDLLGGIRRKLAELDKRVGAIVIDGAGQVIGGVAIDGKPARRSMLAAATWRDLPPNGYGERRVAVSEDEPVELLVGSARTTNLPPGWSVIMVEAMSDALAPVRTIRNRWMLVIACILSAGLAVAILLARQVMRPLDEVTRATSHVASHPDRELPLLPVRSRNEVGQLAESFNKMTGELKRSQEEALTAAKFAFAGELAAMVAHEVRTPLSVMRSSAQMLADARSIGPAHGVELVETIVGEVDRVERVVTGLIQLARPMEQRLEPTRLRDVLSRAADFAAASAERQGIRIVRDLEGAAERALCDPEQIYQVVLNLVVNALQALPPGGSIRLRVLPADSVTAGFAVEDDGPGLPPEIRDQLFRPFVTGREEGTGLGLAFVDRIVKAHRGTIAVQSEPGRGTKFEVRLPLAKRFDAPHA